MEMNSTKSEQVRELSEIELDQVSGGTVMWGAAVGSPVEPNPS
jgi:hypothetical protein